MASQSMPSHFHAHEVLGNFSLDDNGVYRDDRRMRRIFVEPDDDVRSMNLLEGIDDCGEQASLTSGQGKQPSSMTSLLQWMRDHRGELVVHDILKTSENGKATRFTALKWWSQAVIAGIPEVLCGWRDYENEKSILSSTELMKTDEFPQRAPMAGNGRRYWDPETCLDTFHTLLANIKDLIKEDNPKIVHRLELYEVQQGADTKKRLQARRFKLLGSREDDYAILPDWYLRDFLKIHDHDKNV